MTNYSFSFNKYLHAHYTQATSSYLNRGQSLSPTNRPIR